MLSFLFAGRDGSWWWSVTALSMGKLLNCVLKRVLHSVLTIMAVGSELQVHTETSEKNALQ